MTETTKALRSKEDGNNHALHSTHPASPRSVNRPGLLMLLFAGLIAGLSSQAQADPTANRIFFECTFTTGAATTDGTLNSALNISSQDLSLLQSNQVQASYILIYVRENPNEGQDLKNSSSFTGPILCTNEDTVGIVVTTEGTEIPGPVDITGAEEASHLQYRPTGGTVADTEKRVCHTVASNTDCFLIQPQP
jgi:hypothetical protein